MPAWIVRFVGSVSATASVAGVNGAPWLAWRNTHSFSFDDESRVSGPRRPRQDSPEPLWVEADHEAVLDPPDPKRSAKILGRDVELLAPNHDCSWLSDQAGRALGGGAGGLGGYQRRRLDARYPQARRQHCQPCLERVGIHDSASASKTNTRPPSLDRDGGIHRRRCAQPRGELLDAGSWERETQWDRSRLPDSEQVADEADAAGARLGQRLVDLGLSAKRGSRSRDGAERPDERQRAGVPHARPHPEQARGLVRRETAHGNAVDANAGRNALAEPGGFDDHDRGRGYGKNDRHRRDRRAGSPGASAGLRRRVSRSRAWTANSASRSTARRRPLPNPLI
jgi:hypothetical protein